MYPIEGQVITTVMSTPPTLQNVLVDTIADYDMADQYEDALRFEERYVRDVVFFLADDGSEPNSEEAAKDVKNSGDKETEANEAHTQPQNQTDINAIEEARANESRAPASDGINPTKESLLEDTTKGTDAKDSTTSVKSNVDEIGVESVKEKDEVDQSFEYVPTEKEVMEIFEERERRFTEEVLSPRCLSPDICPEKPRFGSMKRSRSRSPCSPVIGSGLEHLDNLVKLLEQLSKLKVQNRCLRKKCLYLENTKSLLYVHNIMLKTQMARTSSPKIKGRSKSVKIPGRSKVLQHQHVSDGEILGHRYASDSSDEEGLREQAACWTKASKLTQRSQSVGSINVDLVDIDLTLGTRHNGQHHLSKRRDKAVKEFNRFEAMFSKSKISSKWERVKKVFSGKPEASTKSEHATITAEQLVRANSKYMSKPPSSLPQMIPGAAASSSTHDSLEKQSRTSTSPSSPTTGPAEPSSPVSLENEPIIPCVIAEDQDSYDEIMVMGGMDSFLDADSSSHGNHSPSPFSDDSQVETRFPTPRPGSMSASADAEKSKSNFLTVQQTSLKRRQSSPTLCISDDSDAHSTEARGDSLELPRTPTIQRSSSFKVTKSTDSFADVSDDSSNRATTPKGTEGRKCHSHRSAWGRVKDIIHTRKDSLKRKNKRSNSAGDMLPDASTMDGLYDYGSKSDAEDVTYDRDNIEDVSPRSSSPRLVRKGSGFKGHPSGSPRGSPSRARKLERPESPAIARRKGPEAMKSPSGSPPPPVCKEMASSAPARGSTSPGPGPLDVSALMGGMSEEFNRKMQEWEEKKSHRRSLFKDNSISLEDDGKDSADAARFTEEFIRKMEEWERMKGLGSPPKSRPGVSQTQSPDVCTPPDHSGAPPSMEELQKHLSESFSKTVQEWERIKTQRIKETGSPIQDTGSKGMDKRSRKQERSKSRERDRSRSKYDKQRERELQKIEKKELKIEKERQKLEKMKQKLEGIETKGEVYAEGVSQEFARKLHEWEVMKGLRSEHASATGGEDSLVTVETSIDVNNRIMVTTKQTTHTRSHSAKDYKEYFSEKRERTQSESQVDDYGAINGNGYERRKSEAGRSASVPSVRSGQLVDDSTSIDLNLTNQDTQSVDEWKRTLLTDLAAKDEELSAMHHEVQQLTERISYMDIDHNKHIENYKRELWASSQVGRFTIETDLVQASVNELRQKVDHLTGYQGKLVNERNHLQTQMEAELKSRQQLEAKLIKQVRQLPVRASHHQQAVESVQDFDKLCEFFLKLWSQLNELRLGILERNKLLADMQQHVLQQEVGNRLLAAEMASRDLQLTYLQGARKRRVLRRSHTFAGRDHMTRGSGDTRIWTKQYQAPNYYALFSSAIEELKHGDIEAAPVDWEWLERLRAQRASAIGRLQSVAAMSSHESHIESRAKAVDSTLTDNSAQTVMTLCNIPLGPNLTPPQSKSPIVLENKGVQASPMTDPDFAQSPQIQAKLGITATSTPAKVPSPSSHPANRPQLVRQRRADSSHSSLSPTPSPAKKNNSAEAAFTFNVSNTERAGLVDVITKRLKEDQHRNVPKSPDLNSQDSSDGDSKMTEVGGPWIRRFGVTTDEEGETMVPSLYPPPSPIIRSRNTRKLKTEFRTPQLYTDARTWKATPPKRVRHRRTSTEKRPDINNHTDKGDENAENPPKTSTLPPRGRARAERFSVPQPRSLSVPPRDSVMYDLCFRDRRDVPKDMGSGSVNDMINKFEADGSPSQINCCRGNRSPSPAIRKPMMSPVHKLKSAAELMKDSPGPRKGWHSAGHTTRATSLSPVPHGSSDKENERAESRVQQIVQRMSRENTPERKVAGAVGGRPMSPTGELIRQTVRRLSESSCDVKPALIDLTNGGHIATKSDSFTERRFSPDRSSPSRTLAAIKKHYELPRKGQVSKFTKVYETKVETKEVIVESISKRASMPITPSESMSKSPVCDSIKSIPAALKAEEENVPQKENPPSRSQTLERVPKSPSASSSPTSTLSGSARDLKMKLFGKKEKKGGALAALCKQTLTFDAVKSSENVHVSDEGMSSGSDSLKRAENPHEKSSKTRRFLDTNWLQKPKRFFKVSK